MHFAKNYISFLEDLHCAPHPSVSQRQRTKNMKYFPNPLTEIDKYFLSGTSKSQLFSHCSRREGEEFVQPFFISMLFVWDFLF